MCWKPDNEWSLVSFFFFIFYRKILAPGEEEHLEFEEDDEEGGAGAGSPDSFPARVPGRGTSLAVPAYVMCKFCLWEAPFSTCDVKSLGEEPQANVNSNAVLENHKGGQWIFFFSANNVLLQNSCMDNLWGWCHLPQIISLYSLFKLSIFIPCTFLTVLCELFQTPSNVNCGNVSPARTITSCKRCDKLLLVIFVLHHLVRQWLRLNLSSERIKRG